MIKAGISDGSAYRAGELIRILLHHPDVQLRWVTSRRNAGKRVADVHRGLTGDTDMVFADAPEFDKVDVVFLCGGSLRGEDCPDNVKVIDLTVGERLSSAGGDADEVDPATWVYGLPERNRKPLVRGAMKSVCPAPLAMALELSVLPLARHLMLNSEINATAIVGSSEAGESLNEDTHTRRNDNIIPSAVLAHDALPEVSALITSLQPGYDGKIHLVELSGPFSRGIMTVCYLDCPVDLEELKSIYEQTYDDHNFTFITNGIPDLKDVVNTNKCLIHLSKSGDKLVVVSVIDNLLKGAAGNAVHLMNLLFGLSERTGLELKASAY